MMKSYPNEKIKKRPLANGQVKSDLKRFAKILITRFCRAEKLKKVRDPPLTQRSGARLFNCQIYVPSNYFSVYLL